MHEASLVGGILRIAEDEAQKHCVTQISRVFVSVGFFTCIDTYMLEECFALMAQEDIVRGATLCVSRRTLSCHCEACKHDFTLQSRPLRCPLCTTYDVQFVDGYGVTIESIEAQSV